MNKGKRAKKNSKIMDFKVFIIFIIIIAIIVIGIVAYNNIKKMNTTSAKITDPTINVYYINKDDEAIEISEGQVITKNISIISNKGNITIKRKEEKQFKEYNKEKLTDGVYLVEVKTENGLAQKNFTIDTLPPIVSGVEDNKTYNTPQKIKFDDIKDVGKATLTKDDETVIDLKAKGNKEYTVEEDGIYILRVEDKYGNAILPILFEIRNSSN